MVGDGSSRPLDLSGIVLEENPGLPSIGGRIHRTVHHDAVLSGDWWIGDPGELSCSVRVVRILFVSICEAVRARVSRVHGTCRPVERGSCGDLHGHPRGQ